MRLEHARRSKHPVASSRARHAALPIMALCTTLLLGGCQSGWDTPPDLGQSVNEAIQAQLVNPTAPASNAPAPRGMDGPAAKYTIDNYDKSFRDPRINRSNLGSVTGQTSSGTSSGSNTTPANR